MIISLSRKKEIEGVQPLFSNPAKNLTEAPKIVTVTTSYTDLAREAEEVLKQAISTGDPAEFIKGYNLYEKAILYFEGVGKTKEANILLERLEKILQVVIDRGDLDAPFYSKLGPFFVLYSYHFKARILEALNQDLSAAVKARVGALEIAEGIEWIEQIINIIVDLLLEDYDEYCLRYLKYAKDKKDELIDELAGQIEQMQENNNRGWLFKKKNDPHQDAENIYNSFLRLIAMMVERYSKGESILKDGFEALRSLKVYSKDDFDYLDTRLLALEAHIRGFATDDIDSFEESHVRSKILPYTLMDNPNLKRLEQLMSAYARKMNLNIPVSISEVPILGANPAGSPHLAIVGQTGVGKTTLTKHILKENRRVQDTTVFIFDHHLEYSDIADQIIQIGGERKPEATIHFPVEEIGETFKTAQEHIRNQQSIFSREGASPEDLAKKIQDIEEQTRPNVMRFVVETIEALLDKEEEAVLPVSSLDTVVFWITMDEPWITTTVISTILKRLLNMAIQEKVENNVIIVTEEAQNLSNDKWLKNLASEGRKFGLYLVAISQAPEFDPWVVSNSELIVFKLRKAFSVNSDLYNLFTPEILKMIPVLDVGEYLSYHRDLRSWVLSYNPETLSPVHAKQAVEAKIEQLEKLLS
ncbi:MAG: DUF87 domain-containing protein [Methanobacteriota archaeon]|nr:MAG: DUF87 domain-containing protein [Euryarchaeota archaeon]